MDDVERRDLRCICCGSADDLETHHRILGDRSDNRASNRIRATRTCHALWHSGSRSARERGYIVSRHRPRADTLIQPVWYGQPNLGRTGWHLLDDDGRAIPCDARGVPTEGA